MENWLLENILAEIKGLMVDITGQPNCEFETVSQIDLFIGDIEKILKENIK